MGEAAFQANFAVGRATLVEDAVRLLDEPAAPVMVTTTVLSPRELEVVALIAQGLTNRQIAERLVISERTTHAHVRNILDKLDLGSRTQVATWAVEHGLPSH